MYMYIQCTIVFIYVQTDSKKERWIQICAHFYFYAQVPEVFRYDVIQHHVVVAVCCSVLQCVAVCCSVLQCVAVASYDVIQHHVVVAVCCSVLQCVAVCCSVLQCVAVCCSRVIRRDTASCIFYD